MRGGGGGGGGNSLLRNDRNTIKLNTYYIFWNDFYADFCFKKNNNKHTHTEKKKVLQCIRVHYFRKLKYMEKKKSLYKPTIWTWKGMGNLRQFLNSFGDTWYISMNFVVVVDIGDFDFTYNVVGWY